MLTAVDSNKNYAVQIQTQQELYFCCYYYMGISLQDLIFDAGLAKN
jgi:hypothetical protein